MAEEAHAQLPKGTRIDHFILDEVIGTGGFSITYLAHDERLQRKVAIKEYFPSQAVRGADSCSIAARSGTGEEYRFGLERFLEEGRLLAQFNHPNIIRVEAYLEAHGTAYLVMEYVVGETLGELLKREPSLPEPQLLSLLDGLLAGLEEVHAAGMLHRDIKPANIYLRRDGTPVLLDFGAARFASAQHSHSLTGIVTPGYSPPEQSSERASNQGPWSDLYAVGGTLYQCMSGQRPCPAPDRLIAIAQGDPDPLGSIGEVSNGAYSQVLIKATDWMLSPVATARPQRVAEVRECLAGEVPTAKIVHGSQSPKATAERPRQTSPAPILEAHLDSDATVMAAGQRVEPRARPVKRWFLVALPVLLLLLAVLWPESKNDIQEPREDLPAQASGLGAKEGKATSLASPKTNRTPGEVFRDRLTDGSLGPEMVVIPAGEFRMGDLAGVGGSGEKPVHRVSISRPFALGKSEVTVGQFLQFVQSTRYRTDAERNVRGEGCALLDQEKSSGEKPELKWVGGSSWKNPGFAQTRDHPVTCVSWNDAQAYVKWLSKQTSRPYRLPSEAEWEYAARAGLEQLYGFGDEGSEICTHANGRDAGSVGSAFPSWKDKGAACNDGHLYTAPVKTFGLNPFGLADMHGNVWEWTEDCWNGSYLGAPAQGEAWVDGGDCDLRVLRGGSWIHKPQLLRSANRGWDYRDYRNVDIGFRLLQDL